MLASIEVHDFAYIEQARFELPAHGFCVLTGETGVGKSLLIDALALALGGRLTRGVVREGAQQAEVSLLLALPVATSLRQQLAEQGFGQVGDELLVRRTIDGNRRSRAYINGRAATVGQLAELTGRLVSICGQHEHLLLRASDHRRELLDATANSAQTVVATATAYGNWKQAQSELEQAVAGAEKVAGRIAELQAIVADCQGLSLSTERWQEQNRILTLQGSAAELSELHGQLNAALSEATQVLAQCRSVVQRLAELDPRVKELAEQLTSLEVIGQEADREASQLPGDSDELDPAALVEAESFVAECHRLARRFRLVGPEALPEFLTEVQAELNSLTAADVGALENNVAAARKTWDEAAAALSTKRAAAGAKLDRQVQGTTRRLGMPTARFGVQLEPRAAPSPHGAETVNFGFAARKSGELADLAEVASGGELSRISLALFTHAVGAHAGALVFDEVDAGVGGRAAANVGSLLAELGEQRLVLCVTHLPQVAAEAQHHWLVSAESGTAIFTAVTGTRREEEIARMLAGRTVTKASRDNAKDILAAAGK